MKRVAPKNPIAASPAPVQPSSDNAQLALREAAVLMAPIALWLLRHGVSYPAFAETLKAVFLQAASIELDRAGSQPTQSALSLLSGLHRKDVRDLAAAPVADRSPQRPPLSSQVLTRWLTDRRYRSANGKPRTLPRTGSGRTFESMCRELSNDVHPRAVLDEMLRLGQVTLDGERVVLVASAFIPAARLDEMTALFSANAADHVAAAVSNLTTHAPRFLEQSIYADGLTAESIGHLHAASRHAWARAFESVVTEARARVDHDRDGDGEQRMRFGVYFFSEPAPAAEPSKPPRNRTSPQRRRPRTST
jgi:hypothetical protein